MDLGLRGKAAVVSGSTAGIGLAIATALAAEGAKVVVNGRTEARVAAALDKIRQRVANAELRGVAADLGTANGVDAFLKQVTEADVLVNNLGIFEVKPFAEIPDEAWMRLFEVNVLSGIRLTRKYLPGMLKKKLGSRHFHFQRIRPAHSSGDDSLRHDQDRPGGHRARPRGIRGRKRCHRELGSGGPDGVGRCR
jgi:NAD(P)-dependent dehydrogenase (short-subunit alcohol dehydrogenase family)